MSTSAETEDLLSGMNRAEKRNFFSGSSAIWVMVRENTMGNKNKTKDPLPDSFATEEEAGAFWDTHSAADYAEYFESVDDVIEVRSRVFEVQIAEDVFQRLRQEAESSHESVPKIVDQILRKQLTLA